jgi:hypothetical protein
MAVTAAAWPYSWLRVLWPWPIRLQMRYLIQRIDAAVARRRGCSVGTAMRSRQLLVETRLWMRDSAVKKILSMVSELSTRRDPYKNENVPIF